jgi:hypothetical protein
MGNTGSYSAIANLHNSQFTTAPAKLFQIAVSSPIVPWRRILTLKILQLHALRFYLHSFPCRTWSLVGNSSQQWKFFSFCAHAVACWLMLLTTELVDSNCPAHNISARTTHKTLFFYCCVRVRHCGSVFTDPLSRNSRGADHRKHRSSVAVRVYVVGVTYQRPLFTK